MSDTLKPQTLEERLSALTARVADLEAFRRAVLENPYSLVEWKPGERSRMVNGVKVYRSYEDYVDD